MIWKFSNCSASSVQFIIFFDETINILEVADISKKIIKNLAMDRKSKQQNG